MPVTIYTDGGCRGNPGPSSAGVWVPALNIRSGYYLGDGCTNNEAEYSALIIAFVKAKMYAWTDLAIYADSELMVKQMNGVYAVKAPKVKPLFDQARTWAAKFRSVTYTHVKRALNKEADAICNEVLDRAAKNADEVVYSFVQRPLPGGSYS